MNTDVKKFSVADLAMLVDGHVDGTKDTLISALVPSTEPSNQAITYMVGKFVNLETAEKFGAIIVTSEGRDKIRKSGCNTPLIICENPQKGSLQLIDSFFSRIPPNEIFPKEITAIYGKDVELGKDCVIHPNVVIYPNVKIGARTIVYSGVVIREDTIIGEDCIIHANAVIGADGFGYAPDPVEGLKAIPQVGNVVISDKVHIGANTTIDRGTLGSTRIGFGTKIDNQVQIGHNVQIGKFCIICGQVGIGGSCIIEDKVVLAGKVGVADHVHLVTGVRVGGGSNAMTDLLEAGDYAGIPAIKLTTYQRSTVEFSRLSQTLTKIRKQLAR